ncbi:hypothetical protein, partial [Falsihalocynthiibacter sp. CO-5D18]
TYPYNSEESISPSAEKEEEAIPAIFLRLENVLLRAVSIERNYNRVNDEIDRLEAFRSRINLRENMLDNVSVISPPFTNPQSVNLPVKVTTFIFGVFGLALGLMAALLAEGRMPKKVPAPPNPVKSKRRPRR